MPTPPILQRLWPFKPKSPASASGQGLRIVMVCTGNICRSPTAEAVMREHLLRAGLFERIAVDSAGTHAHEGSPPDPRSQREAQARGYDLSKLRGRQLLPGDFAQSDLLLAMDDANMAWLDRFAPTPCRARRALLTERSIRFAGASEIPDPYYGSPEGFAHVLEMIEDACAGWIPLLREWPMAAESSAVTNGE